jgi:hypothetical protein
MQAYQIIRIVGEVAVHLKYVLVATLQGPAEAGYISGAQSQFTFALQQKKFIVVFFCRDLTISAVPSGEPSSMIKGESREEAKKLSAPSALYSLFHCRWV